MSSINFPAFSRRGSSRLHSLKRAGAAVLSGALVMTMSPYPYQLSAFADEPSSETVIEVDTANAGPSEEQDSAAPGSPAEQPLSDVPTLSYSQQSAGISPMSTAEAIREYNAVEEKEGASPVDHLASAMSLMSLDDGGGDGNSDGFSLLSLFSAEDDGEDDAPDDLSSALPIEANGAKIESLTLSWKTPDDYEDGNPNRLSLQSSDGSTRAVALSLEASFSGVRSYSPGDICFTVPSSMFKNRNGEKIGQFQIQAGAGMFACTDNGDNTVSIVNTKSLPAAASVLIQFGFTGISPSMLVGDGATPSDPFWADLIVRTAASDAANIPIGMTVSGFDATMLTGIRATGASASRSAVYDNWDASMFPADLKPSDPGSYYYVSWVDRANIEGSQAYASDISATVSGVPGIKIIGVFRASDPKVFRNDSDSDSLSMRLSDFSMEVPRGSYAYVYAAFPKASLTPGETYTLQQDVTYRITAVDTGEESTVEATSTVSYTPFDNNHPKGTVGIADWTSPVLSSIGLNQLRDGEDASMLDFSVVSGSFVPMLSAAAEYSTDLPESELYKKSYTVETEYYQPRWNNSDVLSSEDFQIDHVRLSEISVYEYVTVGSESSGYRVNSEGNPEFGTLQPGEKGFVLSNRSDLRPSFVLEGKINGAWTKLGEVKWGADGQEVYEGVNGATCEEKNRAFALPAGVAEVRATATTKAAAVRYRIGLMARLKANSSTSAQAKELYANSTLPVSYMQMEASVKAKAEPGWNFGSNYEIGPTACTIGGQVNGISDAADLLVSTVAYEPHNPMNRSDKYTFRYLLSMQHSTSLSAGDWENAKERGYIAPERDGMWYCLLPPGMTVDTVSGGIAVNSPDISVIDKKLVKNWRGCGRDMLIVKTRSEHKLALTDSDGSLLKVKGLEEAVRLIVCGTVSSEDMSEFGTDIRLIAAYVSSNGKLGSAPDLTAEPGTASTRNHQNTRAAVAGYESEMSGLSARYFAEPHTSDDYASDSGAPVIYAKDTDEHLLLIGGVFGLSKSVSVDGGRTFVTGGEDERANVYANDEYIYRIRETAATQSETNVVLYDKLDSYTLPSDSPDVGDTTWRGHLESVDVSRLVSAGAAPVVYYSVKKDLDLDNKEDRDLADDSVWSTVPPDDMGAVTAVAVDASKSRTGEDFVLNPGRSLSVFLHMRAPSISEIVDEARASGTVPPDAAASQWYNNPGAASESGLPGGAHAYNGAARTSVLEGGSEEQYVSTGYTKVGILPFYLDVKKVWSDSSDADKKRPKSIVVGITANGEEVTEATLSSAGASGDTWKTVRIDDLPYKDASGNIIEYGITEKIGDGGVLEEYRASTKSSNAIVNGGKLTTFTVTNYRKEDSIQLRVEKVWNDHDDYDKVRPAYARINVYGFSSAIANGGVEKITDFALYDGNNWVRDDIVLPKGSKGVQYDYYEVREDPISNYIARTTINGENTFEFASSAGNKTFDIVIENTHKLETVRPNATKRWEDNSNHDQIRPDTVTMDLYANGVLVPEGAVTFTNCQKASANDVRQMNAPDMLRYDGQGGEIDYTFVEREAEGYTPTVEKSTFVRGGGITFKETAVVNEHSNEQAAYTVKKTWDDNENASGARPDHISIDVLANGTKIDEIVLTGEPDEPVWTSDVSYDRLDARAREIEYTFTEANVPSGYWSEQSSPSIPEFVNHYYPYGDLEIEKTISNATEVSATTEFPFTLEVLDSDGSPVADRWSWERGDGSRGYVENGGTIPVLGNVSMKVLRLPSECTYTLTERASSGWSLAPGQLATASGSVSPKSSNKAVFRNEYRTTGTMLVSGKKTVSGVSSDTGMKRFDFTVSRVDGEKETVIARTTNDAAGDIIFPPISYGASDHGKSFHYIVRESADTERPGYAYDSRSYDVYVDVADNGDGTMSVDSRMERDGSPVSGIEFVNTYEATGSFTAHARKTLSGQDLSAGQFMFELHGEDGSLLSTAANKEDGSVSFPPISYTQDDIGKTFVYTVKEKEGDDQTIIYSKQEFKYQVSVHDRGDGTLQVRTSIYELRSGEEGTDSTTPDLTLNGSDYDIVDYALFKNDSQPGQLRLTKKVRGVEGVDYDPAAEFTFRVKIDSPGEYDYEKEAKTEAWAFYTPDDKTMRFVRGADENKAKDRLTEVLGGPVPEGTLSFTGFEKTEPMPELAEWGSISDYDFYTRVTPKWKEDYSFYSQEIEKAVFCDTVEPNNCYSWFGGCSELKSIEGLSNLDLSGCDMFSNFAESTKVEEVDANALDVSNCQVIERIFSGTRIKYIDLSEWDTSHAAVVANVVSGQSLREVTVGKNFTLDGVDYINFDNLPFGYDFKAVDKKTGKQYDQQYESGYDDDGNYITRYILPSNTTFKFLSRGYGVYTENGTLTLTRDWIDLGIGDEYNGSKIERIYDYSSQWNGLDALYADPYENRYAESPWKEIKDTCRKVVIECVIDSGNQSGWNHLFDGFRALEEIEGMDKIVSVYGSTDYMFYQCDSLRYVDLSSFDTPSDDWYFYATHMFANGTDNYGALTYIPSLVKVKLDGIYPVGRGGYLPKGTWVCEETGEEYSEQDIPQDATGIFIKVSDENGDPIQREVLEADKPSVFNASDSSDLEIVGLPPATGHDGSIIGDLGIARTRFAAVVGNNDDNPGTTDGTSGLSLFQNYMVLANAASVSSVEDDESAQRKTVTLDANGGYFETPGKTKTDLRYIYSETEITKCVHTDNVDDNGQALGDGYGHNKEYVEEVKIPGASKLTVTITYQTESTSYDYVALLKPGVFATHNNVTEANTFVPVGASSNEYKRGGQSIQTSTYEIPGDTARIFFRSDGSVDGFYGYYAVVKGTGQDYILSSDTPVIKPQHPCPDDNIFGGWSSSATEYIKTDPADADDGATLYAYWKAPACWAGLYGNSDILVIGVGDEAPDTYNGYPKIKQYFGEPWSNNDPADLCTRTPSGYFYVPWMNEMYNIKEVHIADRIRPITTEYWFSNFNSVTQYYGLENIDMSRCVSTESMFTWNNSIQSFDPAMSSWDMSNVTILRSMFSGCSKIEDASFVSAWNIPNAKSLESIFSDCNMLRTLDLSNWNPQHLGEQIRDDMPYGEGNGGIYSMFSNCHALERIDGISDWDVSPCSRFDHLFAYCYNLKEVDVANWDVSHGFSFYSVFENCASLESIKLNWHFTMSDLPSVHRTDTLALSRMFTGCENIKTIDLSGCSLDDKFEPYETEWGYVYDHMQIDLSSLVSGCSSLEEIDLRAFDVVNPDVSYASWGLYPGNEWFAGCSSLRRVSFSPFTASVMATDIGWMPDPPSEDKYTGKWISYNSDNGKGAGPYTTEELLSVLAADSAAAAGVWQWETTSLDASSGEFEVIIHPNESILIPDIPAGTSYSVSEKTTAGWVQVEQGTKDVSGRIVSRQTSTAQIENEYATNKTRADISIKKLIDGAVPTADESYSRKGEPYFSFSLYEASYDGHQTGDDPIATSVADDMGWVSFEPIEYTNVSDKTNGDDHYYIIKENNTPAMEYFHTADPLLVKVHVADDGAGHLSNVVEYPDGNQMDNISVPGKLVIEKKTTGTSSPAVFTFDVSLTDPSGSTMQKTVQITGQGSTEIDIPLGTSWSVSERDIPAGWKQVSSENETGTYKMGSPIETVALFENAYEATPASAMFIATKRMADGTLPDDEEFSFGVWDISDDPEAESPAENAEPLSTAKCASDGSVIFDMMEYKKPGTKTYLIGEIDKGDPAVEYDGHYEKTAVNVLDGGQGHLFATTVYDEDGAVFTNSRKPAELVIEKKAPNRPEDDALEYQFSVKLSREATGKTDNVETVLPVSPWVRYSSAGDVVDEGEFAENAVVSMRAGEHIVISAPAGTSYEVSEIEKPGFAAESTGEAGVLEAPGSTVTAVFTNTYFASGVLTAMALKNADGFDLNDGQFTFELSGGAFDATSGNSRSSDSRTSDSATAARAAGDSMAADSNSDSDTIIAVTSDSNADDGVAGADIMPDANAPDVDDSRTVLFSQNDSDGSISFPAITYTQDDAGRQFVYIVSEKDDAQFGITYDRQTYRLVVEVHDNSDGTLDTRQWIVPGNEELPMTDNGSIDTASLDKAHAPNEIVFTNSRAAEEIHLPFTGMSGTTGLTITGIAVLLIGLAIVGARELRRRDVLLFHREDE